MPVGSLVAVLSILCLSSASATTRYVLNNSPSPVSPYTNWATAAAAIQNAVNVAVPGDTVMVSNGTYVVTNAVLIANGISVLSVNGASVTTIDANSNSIRCLYVSHPDAVVRGFTLTRGRSGVAGAGAYLNLGGTLQDCTIRDNGTGAGDGGGVCLYYGGSIQGCTIEDNAGAHGGGLYLDHGGAVYNCSITGNVAAAGGGVYCSYGGGVSNSVVSGNQGDDGGGVYFDHGGAAYNCSIAENDGSSVGGVNCFYGGGVYNCTIAGNQANPTSRAPAYASDGLYSSGSTATAENSIIYFNGGTNYAGSIDWSRCCTAPMPTNGTGNISSDPQFTNTVKGDYGLLSGSPCIDKGTNRQWMAAIPDLVGNWRVVNRVVDMGAFEYNSWPVRLWVGTVDLWTGWKYSPWFGYFQDGNNTWNSRIWHMELGWMYPSGTTAESIWFWDYRMQGWLWTYAKLYPFLWSDSRHAWLWYYRNTGQGAGGWFYNYGTGQAEWM